MSVPLTTKPAAVSREMKNPFRFALGALRWTLALPQFVLPFVRTNKIRKFLGYAVAVCIGCIVVSALLVFPSLVGEGGALVGGANRRMPSMPSCKSALFVLFYLQPLGAWRHRVQVNNVSRQPSSYDHFGCSSQIKA